MDQAIAYVALLRGINVGGHKKVPMAELRARLEALGFTQVITILNSGNVIFRTTTEKERVLESTVTEQLASHFGFSIPVLVRQAEAINTIIQRDPFQDVEVTKDTRLYVTFLPETSTADLTLPWTSEDGSFRILEIQDNMVCSVLDLSVTKTPKGMEALEKLFGKQITTRNWNTLLRIADKLA
ncbi:MAG: DUF1697 domain-containing protein [Cyclobacteriaceae bacterium]